MNPQFASNSFNNWETYSNMKQAKDKMEMLVGMIKHISNEMDSHKMIDKMFQVSERSERALRKTRNIYIRANANIIYTRSPLAPLKMRAISLRSLGADVEEHP